MYYTRNADRKMFYGAKPLIFERAKLLRENMTDSEVMLWSRLNKNQLGVRFKPQHPIATFVVDFYCHELLLVIEVDGGYHLNIIQMDQSRSEELEKYNLTLVRFTNEEIIRDIDSVVNKIRNLVKHLKLSK